MIDSMYKMIEGNTSYPNLTIRENPLRGEDRLPMGSAVLAVFGLSLLGWVVILGPAVAFLHN
jgi:hypothetical protein